MKKQTTAQKKNTTPTADRWTFEAHTVTVNGQTFPASYSIGKSGDVYVFTQIKTAGVDAMPVRIHFGQDMPQHAEALAAAQAEKASGKIAPELDPTATKAAPAPAAEAPAPAPEAAPAPAADPAPAPAAEAAPAAAADPAPAPAAEAAPAPAAEAAPAAAKTWIGSQINGQGWRILFDGETARTRVIFDADPTPAQREALDAAKFFYSSTMKSYNKHLTCKAYRAAVALASTLAAIA